MPTLALALVLVLGSAQEGKKGLFDSAVEPIRHLSAGFTDFAEGKDLAEALKPWNVLGPDEKGQAEIREALRIVGAATIACLGLELELYYFREGQGVYAVRLTLFADGADVRVVDFSAQPTTSGPSKSFGIGDCKDSLAGLGGAADAIVKRLADEKCGDLPFADPEKVAKASGGLGDVGGRTIAEARNRFSEKRAEIAAVKCDDVRLQIDDLLILALDTDGKAVGTFKSEFLLDVGTLKFKLRKFKPIRK